ncbi:MAG: threonine synthase, partial [Hyphomicrobiales bacterium]|nr:threonine synthase [Hyphomicrobiales bacterium]
MRYVSTRGVAPELGFADAMLAGLARDGGLYVPAEAPRLSEATIKSFAGAPYETVAAAVMAPFVGDAMTPSALRASLESAYADFAHPAKAPLVQLAPNLFGLELFHGPTFAFKDFAMTWLARAMDAELARRGRRATVVGATSGDTGSAAISAFAGRDNVDVFVLFPAGRVSDVQRRQMTTAGAPNAHAIAIEGDFDACQALVKGLFNDHPFRDRHSLAGVNSINWARILAQVVYYFAAAAALGAPRRAVSFSVPTGNFGDVLAGAYARKLGLPVAELLVATNENDVLARTFATGACERRETKPTMSPSMDIQVSSNFERALFDACGRDAATLRARMDSLAQARRFDLAPGELAALRRDYSAVRVDEDACR